MNQPKPCPYCGEQILAVAVKCKHCGSTVAGSSFIVKNQFKLRPLFFVLGAIVVAVFMIGRLYHLNQTGTLFGREFTDADIKMTEQNIRSEYARGNVTVNEVQMVKESPRKLTGFVNIKVPLIGKVNKACSATMGENGQSIWQCQ